LKKWHNGVKIPSEPVEGGISEEVVEDWKALKKEIRVECHRQNCGQLGLRQPPARHAYPRNKKRVAAVFFTTSTTLTSIAIAASWPLSLMAVSYLESPVKPCSWEFQYWQLPHIWHQLTQFLVVQSTRDLGPMDCNRMEFSLEVVRLGWREDGQPI
jgi:hypothetical protein